MTLAGALSLTACHKDGADTRSFELKTNHIYCLGRRCESTGKDSAFDPKAWFAGRRQPEPLRCVEASPEDLLRRIRRQDPCAKYMKVRSPNRERALFIFLRSVFSCDPPGRRLRRRFFCGAYRRSRVKLLKMIIPFAGVILSCGFGVCYGDMK